MSCVSVSLMDMDREGQHALTDQLKGKSCVRDARVLASGPASPRTIWSISSGEAGVAGADDPLRGVHAQRAASF